MGWPEPGTHAGITGGVTAPSGGEVTSAHLPLASPVTDGVISVSFGDLLIEDEYVEHGIGLFRDCRLRRPASHLLIGADTLRQYRLTDPGNRGFCAAAISAAAGRHISTGTGISIAERLAIIDSANQAWRGWKRHRRLHRADAAAMAYAIGLKLLGRRPLLMDVLPWPLRKAASFPWHCRINATDSGDINACVVARIFEHCPRLAALMHTHFSPLQRGPVEVGVLVAASDEKSIHIVDQGEMPCCGRVTLFQRRKPLTDRGLHDLRRSVCQRFQSGYAGFGNTPLKIKTFFSQKVSGHGGDQWGIESRKQSELDMDLGQRMVSRLAIDYVISG